MGWSKDLKASTTDRGAVLRSETYTLVLSSPSSSSSILHLGPVGLCSHLLSLSRSLYSLEQQALNQARQKAHWDPTAGACLSWMCHNTGGLSWGVQPPPPPPPDMGENMKIDMTQRTDHVRLMWQSKAGRMCHVCACFLDNETADCKLNSHWVTCCSHGTAVQNDCSQNVNYGGVWGALTSLIKVECPPK